MNPPPPDLHAELEERLRFEMLLTDLSARFISVTAESIDDEIVNAQGQIVQALDLDRSVLGQLQEGGKGFVYTHSWFRPGIETSSGVATSHLPWMASELARGQVVCFARIDDLPEEAIEEREFARRCGILSNVTFPLHVGGKVIGATSFGTLHREREWPDPIIPRLRLFVEKASTRSRTSLLLWPTTSRIDTDTRFDILAYWRHAREIGHPLLCLYSWIKTSALAQNG